MAQLNPVLLMAQLRTWRADGPRQYHMKHNARTPAGIVAVPTHVGPREI